MRPAFKYLSFQSTLSRVYYFSQKIHKSKQYQPQITRHYQISFSFPNATIHQALTSGGITDNRNATNHGENTGTVIDIALIFQNQHRLNHYAQNAVQDFAYMSEKSLAFWVYCLLI